MAIYNTPSVNAVQKTLDAQLLSGATASATLNNTTNIVNGLGLCVIDRVDANGKSTASKREYISFTGVSGSTITGLTRNVDGGGSDQDHAVGAIVEFLPDVVQAKAVKDVIETEHNTDGTHKSATVTTLKASGAEINTGTEDAKIVTPKAIADSNVPIAGKASGAEINTGTNDTKFVTPKAVKDANILTQAWTAYNPTLTNITEGNGVKTAYYTRIGKTIFFRVHFKFGSTSAMGNAPTFTLPVTSISYPGATNTEQIGVTTFTDDGTALYYGVAMISSTTTAMPRVISTAGTYPVSNYLTATVPMTWAENDEISIFGSYEAA